MLCRSVVICFFLAIFAVNPVYAKDKVIIGINAVINQSLPEVVEKIKTSLRGTDIDLTFVVLPTERELLSAAAGRIAMTSYRQPLAVKDYEDLVQIKPAVNILSFYSFVHPDQEKLCTIEKDGLKQLDTVGILGAKLYEDMVYPQFRSGTDVVNFAQIFTMIEKGRVHLSIAPIPVIEKAMDNTGLKVHICKDKPFLEITFYSYLHKKYLHLKPKIEAAYKNVFPLKVDR